MSVVELTQGHTPHDRLSYIINKLCTELESCHGAALEAARSLAHEAKSVIDGFDNYICQMSSPHPQIVDKMVVDGYRHDWNAVHCEGKTQYRLIPEMSAGGYEAVVLQQLAKISKVQLTLVINVLFY